MLELGAYEALRSRPEAKSVMRQQWRDLLFLHFSVDVEAVQKLLPEGLAVDDWEGRAWIGLVPFRMQKIRPIWGPSLPWISAFPETNVRTYVHHQGKGPGVWFFSLDAARWLACRYARAAFRLPYFHAAMSVRRANRTVEYRSDRLESPKPARLSGSATFGPETRIAIPGTFEFFLVERYLLYSERNGDLFQGRVHHPPYPLREVERYSVEENLVGQTGLTVRPWESALFSDGVDVDVFPLEAVPR